MESQSDNEAEIRGVYKRLSSICAALGVPSRDIQDISQDVWIWLIQNQFQTRASEISWLNQVARFFVLRYWRRRARVPRADALYRDLDTGSHAAVRVMEQRLLLDQIQRRLSKPAALLLSRVRAGENFFEAACRTGIPEGSRSYRKRELIREAQRAAARAGSRLRSSRRGEA